MILSVLNYCVQLFLHVWHTRVEYEQQISGCLFFFFCGKIFPFWRCVAAYLRRESLNRSSVVHVKCSSVWLNMQEPTRVEFFPSRPSLSFFPKHLSSMLRILYSNRRQLPPPDVRSQQTSRRDFSTLQSDKPR